MKYIDPDGRECVGYLYDYFRDPLLAPIPIDTSSYRSTLWSILRVQNRLYGLKDKISEINRSGEYDEYKAKSEYWQEKTLREMDPNNWPQWQQDLAYLFIPPLGKVGVAWAAIVYYLKLEANTWGSVIYLTKQVNLGKYGEKYLELLELLEELRKKYKSFDDDPSDGNNNGGGSGSLPSGGGGDRDLIPI
jgi:hypothetical protein